MNMQEYAREIMEDSLEVPAHTDVTKAYPALYERIVDALYVAESGGFGKAQLRAKRIAERLSSIHPIAGSIAEQIEKMAD